MATTNQKRRVRLKGRKRLRLPGPERGDREEKDKGFYLRVHEELDGRHTVAKLMRRRLQQLLDDTGADTEQKKILCARASFLAAMLESMETDALEGKKLNMGRYIQAVNGLSGTLSRLGIEKQMRREIASLEEYVATKKKERR